MTSVKTKTVWSPQPGPQTTLLRCPVFEVLYGGARGGGKAVLYKERILTPFGWKDFHGLEVGSSICSTEGTVQKVIGVYPQGKRPVYKLVWSDGSETICDENHIWLAWLSNQSRKAVGSRLSGEESAKKWTTKQIAAHYEKTQKTRRRIGIPIIKKPVVFTVQGEAQGPGKHISRVIPPYALGVLLGDGCITGKSVSFCKPDREIAEKVQDQIFKAFGESAVLRESRDLTHTPVWFIPSKIMIPHLEDLGLMGLYSYEKFIPRIYLFAPEEDRWELLRGLMDTDGWVEDDGDCYYCSTSEQLIEDARHLARSMGAIVTLRGKTPHYTYKGGRREGRPAQTIRIKMRDPERMFSLPRKADRCCGKIPQSMAIWLESIEPAGEEETVCIAVSHPNSLYIIDNFIVTHNTDAMLGDFVKHAGQYGEDAIGLCVRRERTQLKEMIERSRQIYGPIGAKYSSQDKQWRFPDGARLTFAYLENDADAEAYQGWNTTRVYVEEMGNFPRPEPIFKLMATLRSGNPDVRVGFRATANPGGPGHLWIRARYIDPAPRGLKILTDKFINPFTKEEKGIERVYIPSKVTDNRFCNNTDYIARLQLAAGTKLLQAWLHGDWDLIEGAFFSEWDDSKHIIKPFAIPTNWTRFVSADWGSAAPFSIGWWAVVSDDYEDIFGPRAHDDGQAAYAGGLPRGAIVRYREWYGSPNHNNVGLKLYAEQVAAGIVERERDEPRNHGGAARIAYRVIDPDACREKGGPSIAERMSWAPHRIFWRPADNARVGRRGAMGGWDAVRARLKGEDGVPMLYIFDNCIDLIRCLPVAQHDPDNMEDIDDCEDHAIDDLRYACMSRPYVATADKEKKDKYFTIGPESKVTLNDILEQYDHRTPKSYERIR